MAGSHHCPTCNRNFLCDIDLCNLEFEYPCSNCDYNAQHLISKYLPSLDELLADLEERRKNCKHPPDKCRTYFGMKVCVNCGKILSKP